jgi:hypothetical protein
VSVLDKPQFDQELPSELEFAQWETIRGCDQFLQTPEIPTRHVFLELAESRENVRNVED